MARNNNQTGDNLEAYDSRNSENTNTQEAYDNDETAVYNREYINEYDNTTETSGTETQSTNQNNSEFPGSSPEESIEEKH